MLLASIPLTKSIKKIDDFQLKKSNGKTKEIEVTEDMTMYGLASAMKEVGVKFGRYLGIDNYQLIIE